ncbi:tyrosine-type recombinase/integrase [Enterocloster clostridioformis]
MAAIEEIFAKYVTAAKSDHPDKFCNGPYTPHVMRLTTATHLIEAGVPLAVVKNILGHSSIQTTQIYLDISQQTVDRSMEEWNNKWLKKTKLNHHCHRRSKIRPIFSCNNDSLFEKIAVYPLIQRHNAFSSNNYSSLINVYEILDYYDVPTGMLGCHRLQDYL